MAESRIGSKALKARRTPYPGTGGTETPGRVQKVGVSCMKRAQGSGSRIVRGVAALALALCASCASWRPVQHYGQWTLYAKQGENVDLERFRKAVVPALEAVEERLGAFREPVHVHAWNGGAELPTDKGGVAPGAGAAGGAEVVPGQLETVPGIGKARVRAFHVHGGSSLFAPTGVFLGTAEAGTAVHELVHARIAELGLELPLWFEEGVASMWGDGALFEGRWVVDGLACWPLRVLRDEPLADSELSRLLRLSARDSYSARDNLLVHFVGWAIVFDLAREMPEAGWRDWLQTFQVSASASSPLEEARTRLRRTLDEASDRQWLARLSNPDPGVRLATAKGLWKLHSTAALQALLTALKDEQHPEVRLGLAVNALLAVNETRVGRSTWRQLWNLVFPTLRDVSVADPLEQSAARDFYRGLRSRGGSTEDALDRLSRFWEE
jgi:hypothetical protein